MERFKEICDTINKSFEDKWNNNSEEYTRILKKALCGYCEEEEYIKREVKQFLHENDLFNENYPPYYQDLTDAVYHENWGMAGMAEWFAKYQDSSSAKIIGDNIYFLIDGEIKLMPQKMALERRRQFAAKLLTIKPDEYKDKDVHEIYLIDGTRVTIYNQSLCKGNQGIIVFRRYVIPEYTFEEQARRGTIPFESIPLFKNMVSLGYNVAFTGAVRTAKTTFLATWQSYEDTTLEGLLIETDPEIPIHKLMPAAPIMQIVADGDKLKSCIKNLMRSDAEYMIMAEARDGIALDAAIRVANKGTRRCKMTFHNRDPITFVYDVASEVIRTEGGEIGYIAEKVAQSFDYIFYFIQLQDKNQKRLDSIHELTFDRETDTVVTTLLCKYSGKDQWSWHNHISEDKKKAGRKENEIAFSNFSNVLDELAQNDPMPTAENVEYKKNYR